MRDDFAVFILTHGRADNIQTLKVLEHGEYSGKLYFLIDNEDEQAEQYISRFGKDNVIIFDKQAQADITDTVDNFGIKRAIVYARNYVYKAAADLGLKYFLQLDDDYTLLQYRWVEHGKLMQIPAKGLDELFSAMIDWLEETGAITVALCQGGDLIGGCKGLNWRKQVLRKCMNSFFCRTDKPINFCGTMNEDVCMYTTYNNRGELMLSIMQSNIVPLATQHTAGGMQDVYLDTGTYTKSFYSVITSPNCCSVSMMGETHYRIHHDITWEHCAPKILNQRWKK